jgi:fucose permease
MNDHYSFQRVFAAACIGMLLFGVVIITLGSILPSLINKFELDEIGAGALTSILPGGILAGSLVFGPLVDRYSYKYLLVISALIIMLGLQGIAITGNIFVLQMSLAAIGFGGGAINGATNALVSDISHSSTSSRGSNLSMLGVFFGIGALGMPSLLGIFSSAFDPYFIIKSIGFCLVVPVIYFSIIDYPNPKNAQGAPLKEGLKLAKDPNLMFLGLILFFQSGIEGIISNWSTLYLESVVSMLKEQALYTLSSFVLSLTLTRILLTFLLNHIRSYQVLIISIFLAALGIFCFMSDFLNMEIIGLILLGAGLAAGFPVILGYVGALYPELSGTAFSMVLAIALTGNILWNFFMGVAASAQGIAVYPIMLLINLICMAGILIITLKRISTRTTI